MLWFTYCCKWLNTAGEKKKYSSREEETQPTGERNSLREEETFLIIRFSAANSRTTSNVLYYLRRIVHISVWSISSWENINGRNFVLNTLYYNLLLLWQIVIIKIIIYKYIIYKYIKLLYTNYYIQILILLSLLLLLLLLLLFTPLEFFTSVLADGFSLEFEWQQVSSSLQDSSKYSGRPQQCCRLDSLYPSANFKVLQAL